jgi:hypothetical protein
MKTEKTHNRIVADIKKTYEDVIKQLTVELEKARSLKDILERVTKERLFKCDGMTIGSYNPLTDGNTLEIKLSDNVATLVPDELGKDIIIKQTSNRVVILDKEGKIKKSGYTKQKVDKGYSYKLVRE